MMLIRVPLRIDEDTFSPIWYAVGKAKSGSSGSRASVILGVISNDRAFRRLRENGFRLRIKVSQQPRCHLA